VVGVRCRVYAPVFVDEEPEALHTAQVAEDHALSAVRRLFDRGEYL